jgi:catechol 1,2-dioxygenase
MKANLSKIGAGRRDFIKTSVLVAIAVSLPGFSGCKGNKTNVLPVPEDCLTTADILGPYYKAGAPLGENIIPTGVKTSPIVIEGKVFSHCKVELENAVVEIWNANAEGSYDTSNQFLFRGKYQTLADGLYRFKTIIPGRYLNGGTYRPSHIHFRITAPGHRELVSQIYFKEDPYLASDPWASDPKAKERILAISKDVNSIDTITFDIHLIEA